MNVAFGLDCKMTQHQKSFPKDLQTSSAREGGLIADSHLSLCSSKSSPSVISSSLQQITSCSLPSLTCPHLLWIPHFFCSWRHFPSPLPTLCSVTAQNSSSHCLGTHRPLLSEEQVGSCRFTPYTPSLQVQSSISSPSTAEQLWSPPWHHLLCITQIFPFNSTLPPLLALSPNSIRYSLGTHRPLQP